MHVYKRIERLIIIILNKVIPVFVFPNIIISMYEHGQRQKNAEDYIKIRFKIVLMSYQKIKIKLKKKEN